MSVRVHTLAWSDTFANLERTLDRRVLREFDMRVVLQMAAQDSTALIDTPLAGALGTNRAYYYSEEQGLLEKFRPYGHNRARLAGGRRSAAWRPCRGDGVRRAGG